MTFEEKKTRKAEMTEQIFDEQQELGKSIQSLYNNYKKDGGVRKTTKYLAAKLVKLNELWQKFLDNHAILQGIEDEESMNAYYVNNYKQQVHAVEEK